MSKDICGLVLYFVKNVNRLIMTKCSIKFLDETRQKLVDDAHSFNIFIIYISYKDVGRMISDYLLLNFLTDLTSLSSELAKLKMVQVDQQNYYHESTAFNN